MGKPSDRFAGGSFQAGESPADMGSPQSDISAHCEREVRCLAATVPWSASLSSRETERLGTLPGGTDVVVELEWVLRPWEKPSLPSSARQLARPDVAPISRLLLTNHAHALPRCLGGGTRKVLLVVAVVSALLLGAATAVHAQGGMQSDMRQDQSEREANRATPSGSETSGLNEERVWVWWIVAIAGGSYYLWRSDRANRRDRDER
jgi:hypothetical protein